MRPDREPSDGMSPETRRERDRQDRRVKIALGLTGTATLLCLAHASLHENLFTEWRNHQEAYAGLHEARAGGPADRGAAGSPEVTIHQVVSPELKTVDRCMSCHPGVTDPRMAGAPRPYGKHPGRILEWHDENRFGCTVCHRGQGRAVNYRDAKAVEAPWDDPMLPAPLTSSSCAQCHAVDEVKSRGGKKLARGKVLFEARGCAGCHKLAGRGGGLGPDLSRAGSKVRQQLPMKHLEGPHTLAQWLAEHFQDPQRVVQGSQMPPPQLGRAENEALTVYVLSLRDRNLPETVLSPGKHLEIYRQAFPDPLDGPSLYARFCAVCHDTGTYGRYDTFFQRFIPAVRGASFVLTASPDYVEENVRQGRPGTLMSGWGEATGGLRPEEIVRLRRFLLEPPPAEPGDAASAPPPHAPLSPPAAPGDPARGGAIFLRQCAGCHGAHGGGGPGPALRNPVLQRTATDAFLFATVAAGRRDTAMPAFSPSPGAGLSEADVAGLVAHIRALTRSAPPAPAAAQPSGRARPPSSRGK